MKSIALLTVALVTGPAIAAETQPAPTVLTVAGEKGFDVKCHVWPRGGDEYVRFLDNGRNSFSANDLWRLACEYKGSPHGPITITINSATLPCPFKDASADACVTTLRKSGVGSFEVKEKARS